MCGIAGLFLKDKSLEPQLGTLLSDMLVTLTDRGPDSAGIAIYGNSGSGSSKITVQSSKAARDFPEIVPALERAGIRSDLLVKDTHAVVTVPRDRVDAARDVLTSVSPQIRFAIRQMSGSHGIAHSRMATESAVTTLGAHPFSTGADQCLVHNGSLSNHNNLRRELKRAGMTFETENDTEVAAAYLTAEMAKGKSLGEALEGTLRDLDGFFTFVVGTKNGFGVVRDPIACKPAVMAETDRYVAFGSEYRALVGLPDITKARVWEPEPATVYFWEH
jgi:glutamate synthase domain-containing protein 1